jgi:hypothetical protein
MRLRERKSWWIVIAALSIVFSSATAAFAQNKPIAGGYAQTSTGSAEVVAAARFAAREQAGNEHAIIFVESVKSAEIQVVSGINYKLGMRVVVYNKPEDVVAVVYKNLKREYSLTSWTVAGKPASDSVGFPSFYADTPLEQLMKALDDAYNTRTMGRLDARRPYLGRVRIAIEHSLAGDGDKDQYEIRTFRTFAQAERWLKSREREDGTPFRETRPLEDCSKGSCTWDFNGGILHNHLYLKEVTYGFVKGRPYIKTIYLLDGD